MWAASSFQKISLYHAKIKITTFKESTFLNMERHGKEGDGWNNGLGRAL